ncbi:unnamed protein product [Linum tenue]|uniref:Uncharacterized protein n=1 Tax=Linum tenue TaxID=586396 RepID=A0AAV0NKN2_9ROSI|nr:unnamed protein product [Linum tenue]
MKKMVNMQFLLRLVVGLLIVVVLSFMGGARPTLAGRAILRRGLRSPDEEHLVPAVRSKSLKAKHG